MGLIRTFIAIETPQGVKDAIRSAQRDLQRIRGANVSWTRSEGIHLTLKFLGDVDSERMPAVVANIREVCAGRAPFSLHTTATGGFPRLARPKVLWLGVSAPQELMALQAAVDMALIDLGYEPEDKAFHPHLTVGRVKFIDRDCSLPQKFGALEFPNVEWVVNEVRVMSSVLKPSGAEYAVIEAVKLM
ncbi:MAG: RNA 2',3'-cyclic phosphodiesterase [Calditrichaeota bacterium]|nr:RNA 2',3'-cyclic phosphodiesterase [Calditrichota bacterium]